MAYIIDLKTFNDSRGSLTVIEKVLPFEIKRVYYIYNTNGAPRGGHKHKKTIQALIGINGICRINVNEREAFILDSPDKCLILNPEDWHTMDNFSKDSILLVLASEYFDADDYIDEL